MQRALCGLQSKYTAPRFSSRGPPPPSLSRSRVEGPREELLLRDGLEFREECLIMDGLENDGVWTDGRP